MGETANGQPTTDEPASSTSTGRGVRIFAGTLHRTQRGRGKAFRKNPPPPPPEPVRQPARVGLALALAHKIQDAIDRGIVADRTDAARRLDWAGARVTQILDLTLLAPDLQEHVLFLEAVDGVEPMSERALNAVLADAADGRFDRLLVATADRLSRVLPDVLALVGELDRLGVTVTVARSPELDWAAMREVFNAGRRIGRTRGAESADEACAVCGARQ